MRRGRWQTEEWMGAMWLIGALAVGAAIGVISGLVGIGGGALLIPVLVYAYGLTQVKAQGTSLATLLLPIGILAFIPYYRAGHVDVKLAILMALGFAAGGWFGGLWAQYLSAVALRRGFAVLLLFLAVKMFFSK